MSKLDQTLQELVNREAESVEALTPPEARTAWEALRKQGTSLWLDTGDMEAADEQWDPAFKALTTNNTLLNKEVQKGTYDEFVVQAATAIKEAEPDLPESQLLLEINLALNASHGLKLVRRYDADVSVELHTDLANDVEASVSYGRRIHALCPDRFIVKVPYTPAGLIAARRLEQHEIPVNQTLGFSARQNYLIARFANPHYVNIFMGRLNSFVESGGLGSGHLVGEKTVLATQQMLNGLREDGNTRSRLISASMRSADQVKTLAGVDVMTMPPEVAGDYAAHSTNMLDPQIGKADDIHIPMQPGYTTADFAGGAFWNLEEPLLLAINNLMASDDIDSLVPDELIAHFENRGLAEFMPQWSLEEIDTILADGKIPPYKTWKDRLKHGEVGPDALMNMSALGAFVNDQKSLDDRIRQRLEMHGG